MRDASRSQNNVCKDNSYRTFTAYQLSILLWQVTALLHFILLRKQILQEVLIKILFFSVIIQHSKLMDG